MTGPDQAVAATGAGTPSTDPVLVIGAGPAGLTAAYELVARGDPVVVVEADAVVGGISRTVERDGWRFDIGGHRFFTKVQAGRGVLAQGAARRGLPAPSPDEPHLLRRQVLRLPDQIGNALSNLGVVEAFLCGLSFLWVRIHPPKDLTTLEGYIVSNYGWRLYDHFFKTYNEKVWAVSASRSPPTGEPSGSRGCRCGTRCGNRSALVGRQAP